MSYTITECEKDFLDCLIINSRKTGKPLVLKATRSSITRALKTTIGSEFDDTTVRIASRDDASIKETVCFIKHI